MSTPRHRIVGLYPTRAAAESASDEVRVLGLAANQARVLLPGSPAGGDDATADSDDVLKDLLRDGAIGGAVGTAAGAGVSVALAAANITLFVANPVLGALYLLGWGASLGGLVGAVVGSERGQGDVPTLIRDALAAGQAVLVVHADTEGQADEARRIVARSMAEAAAPHPAPAGI